MKPIEDSEILDMIEFIRDSGLGIVIKSNLKAMLLELFRERTDFKRFMKLAPDVKKRLNIDLKRYAVLKEKE